MALQRAFEETQFCRTTSRAKTLLTISLPWQSTALNERASRLDANAYSWAPKRREWNLAAAVTLEENRLRRNQGHYVTRYIKKIHCEPALIP